MIPDDVKDAVALYVARNPGCGWLDVQRQLLLDASTARIALRELVSAGRISEGRAGTYRSSSS
jgi:predicted transcriptional regulator